MKINIGEPMIKKPSIFEFRVYFEDSRYRDVEVCKTTDAEKLCDLLEEAMLTRLSNTSNPELIKICDQFSNSEVYLDWPRLGEYGNKPCLLCSWELDCWVSDLGVRHNVEVPDV